MSTLTEYPIEVVSTGSPIFTPEEIAEGKRRGEEFFSRLTPEQIEANHRAWNRFVKEFPQLDDEEIRAIEEVGKEFNSCRIASL